MPRQHLLYSLTNHFFSLMRFRLFHRCRWFVRFGAIWPIYSSWPASTNAIVDFLLLEQSVKELGRANQEDWWFWHHWGILAIVQSCQTADAHLNRVRFDDLSKVNMFVAYFDQLYDIHFFYFNIELILILFKININLLLNYITLFRVNNWLLVTSNQNGRIPPISRVAVSLPKWQKNSATIAWAPIG